MGNRFGTVVTTWLCALLLASSPAIAGTSLSANVNHPVNIINSGVGDMISANFIVGSSVGDSFSMPESSSANFTNKPGFQPSARLVSQSPSITSAGSAAFTVNTPGSFTVTTSGTPAALLSLAGTFPAGITFVPATGTLAGTPALGSAGTYQLLLTAANGSLPNATQSFTLTVGKANQTISFATLAARSFSANAVPLAATSSAGLGVLFTSTTPAICTVVGTNVSLVSIGTCTIAANQTGNVDYNAAAAVQQSFTITIGSQAVSFAPASLVTLGGSPITVTLNASSSSGLNVFTYATSSAANVCTVSGNQLTLVGAGNCALTATQPGNANIGPASASAVVTVSVAAVIPNATVTLTSPTPTIVYGNAVNLVATVTGNAPTGSVTFSVNTNAGVVPLPGCTAIPLAAGIARCIAPAVFQNQSQRLYQAAYSGDANNGGATGFYSQAVAFSGAVLTVTANPLPPVVIGRTATLTALVKMSNPAGSVTFFDNGVAIPGCNQTPVTVLTDAVDAAVVTCTVTAATSPNGIKSYMASYFYPPNHPSGKVFEQASFDMRVIAQVVPDYTDMWWGGFAERGWGLSINQHGGIQFNVIYTYDNAGKSLWYVMPGGSFNAAGTVFTGPLYLPRGAPFSAYDTSKFVIGATVGTATITFTSATTGTLAYTINGVTATKPIERYTYAPETTRSNLRVLDLWWATVAEDGWGLNIAQQGRSLFPVWYTYDENGRATFFTAQGGSWNGTVWTGTLYAHTSSPWLGVPYNPALATATSVGSVSLDFDNASSATMTYTVNGITQVKRIERLAY